MLGALLLVFVTSWALTAQVRRYALVRLLDVPNDRSAHSAPTPRGGGVAFVAVILIGVVLLARWQLLDSRLALGVFGAGVVVAVLGFADDHGHIAARWRLAGHTLAAAWALFWIGGAPPLTLGSQVVDWGLMGLPVAILFIVWFLNLYNFMDGIDGLAAVEALSLCGGGALCALVAGDASLIPMLALTGAAVAGFLCWNFPRARIFMGDAGSGFLGVVLAILALAAAHYRPELLWSWMILAGIFVVDATLTLMRRLLLGERVYQAHRSHAYQFASRRWGHARVTLFVAALNLFWLTPIAVFAAYVRYGVLLLFLAYLPLVALAWKFRAGAAET